jgi:hypothetical protein
VFQIPMDSFECFHMRIQDSMRCDIASSITVTSFSDGQYSQSSDSIFAWIVSIVVA